MSKRTRLTLLILLLFKVFVFSDTPAGTVLSNGASFLASGVTGSVGMTPSLTVGAFYGLSGEVPDAAYTTSPGAVFRIELSLTNEGNDADNTTEVEITSFSNLAAYPLSNWNCYLEVDGSDEGSLYAIPFTDFGAGAVFEFSVVIEVSGWTPTNDTAFLNLQARTSQTTSYYTGLNSWVYGGVSNLTSSSVISLLPPNPLQTIRISDGIDSIYWDDLDGSGRLRRTLHDYRIVFAQAPDDPSSVSLWYSAGGIADGPGGAGDTEISLDWVSHGTFTLQLPEAALSDESTLSFLLEADSVYYNSGFIYQVVDLNDQGYETILMDNVIDENGTGYIKLPEDLIGEEGEIRIFAVSGDEVFEILDGEIEDQIYEWDGCDERGRMCDSGIYFMVISSGSFNEVRKFYVR